MKAIHRRAIGITGCGLVAAMLTINVSAADPQGVPTTQGSGAAALVGQTTTEFIKDAAKGNAAELALGQVAQRKAENAEVKRFAEHMVADHREANRKLHPLAEARSISVNQPLDAKHQKSLERLQSLSGNEFDREYMRAMLKDHQEAIALHEQASRGNDAEVKQYALNALPKLRQHMDHAKIAAKAAGLDDATIAALSRGSAQPMGGAVDGVEAESGSGEHKEHKHKQSEHIQDL